YQHIIAGLEHIKITFFPEQTMIKKIPNPKTFDFDFNSKKYTDITDQMAGDAVQKSINLLRWACKNKIEPKQDLTPLQIHVKESYEDIFISQFANGLKILGIAQGK